LVSKLNILLCAGLTIHKALLRILQDYKNSPSFNNNRFLYKELHTCLTQIDNGVSEGFAYANFGKRIGLNCYIRFSSLLEQNIKKGTNELRLLLTSEVTLANDMKKRLVLQLGEQASTKLLLPMMMLFFIILIIVMFPAFSNMTL
jgi:pilus assembly protein TadC